MGPCPVLGHHLFQETGWKPPIFLGLLGSQNHPQSCPRDTAMWRALALHMAALGLIFGIP